jgi:hypothetical protein
LDFAGKPIGLSGQVCDGAIPWAAKNAVAVSFLVREDLRVRQPGVVVDRVVQVRIACPRPGGSVCP